MSNGRQDIFMNVKTMDSRYVAGEHNTTLNTMQTEESQTLFRRPLNTWRNNNVVITSKRRYFDVITSKWRRCDVITTSLSRDVFAGCEHDELIKGHPPPPPPPPPPLTEKKDTPRYRECAAHLCDKQCAWSFSTIPADIRLGDNVIITSRRRHDVVLT